jgi:hypothetical protein
MAVEALLQSGIPPEKWTQTMLEVQKVPLGQRQRFEIERQQLVQEQASMKLSGATAPQGQGGGAPAQQPTIGGM